VILKLVFLLWFAALFLAFTVKKGKARSWMGRLFVGGFLLLLLGFFLKIVSRLL
jgi:hypothetical protein